MRCIINFEHLSPVQVRVEPQIQLSSVEGFTEPRAASFITHTPLALPGAPGQW